MALPSPWSIFHDSRSHPVCVHTDKVKEFLNEEFQDMLSDEAIQFQVCKNSDEKCAVVERGHRTIRDMLYKYLTSLNTYRFIDVLPKFINAYNDTVHSTTCMASSRVTDADFLATLRCMEAKTPRLPFATAKFRIGQRVRIRKGEMKDKATEHNLRTEIFRIVKVIDRHPGAFYRL